MALFLRFLSACLVIAALQVAAPGNWIEAAQTNGQVMPGQNGSAAAIAPRAGLTHSAAGLAQAARQGGWGAAPAHVAILADRPAQSGAPAPLHPRAPPDVV